MTSGAGRAAIYARISEDPLGLERGVDRQLADCRALATQRGWEIVATFVDNDISAYSGRRRGQYDALMATVDAKQVDRVLCYHSSRLWRSRRERAEGFERLKAARVAVVPVKGPELDLASASGRMVAGILGEMDTAESEIKAERVARAALQRAEQGRANAAVLYGWRREYDRDDRGRILGFRDVVDREQADVVREIVDRLLAGDTIRAVTTDLNDRGIPAPAADSWGKTSVRKIALRPANVARRLWHRGRPDEQLLPAAWEPIIDAEKHERLTVLLAAPERRTQRAASRAHLLTFGIGRCGVCGGVLRVSLKGNARWGTKQRLYVCDDKGCVGRREDYVDALVRETVIVRLSRPDAADLLVADDTDLGPAVDHAQALRARLDSAADAFASGDIDATQLRRITSQLRPELEAAEVEVQRLRAATRVEPLVDVIGDRAAERWDSLSLARQRAVLEAMRVTVTIKPTRRGPGFDPNSVDIGVAPSR